MDRGRHRNKSVQWPKGIDGWTLPAYSPELNPVKRWYKERFGRAPPLYVVEENLEVETIRIE